MKSRLTYQLKDSQGKVIGQSQEASAEITDESLSVLPKFGEAVFFSLRDIVDAEKSDYKIILNLSSQEKLILSDLGYQFEDFFRVMVKKINENTVKDRLITEKPKKSYSEIEFILENGVKKTSGFGELKIYSDRLVMIPLEGEPVSIFFNAITEISDDNFQLRIESSGGISVIFVKLGELFEPMAKLFSGLMNQQSLDIQATLQELFPTVSPTIIRTASRFLKQGQAAQKKELDKVSDELWPVLEKKLGAMNLKPEYDYLISLGDKEEAAIGFKKERGAEFIWFLIPVKKALDLFV